MVSASKGRLLLLGGVLGLAGSGLQVALYPILQADSYQCMLAAVAVSAMYGGARAAAAAFAVTIFARFWVWFSGTSPHVLQGVDAILRFAVYFSMGLLLCAIGRRIKVSERKAEVLEGLLPICARCKKIRDEHADWKQLETYLHQRSPVEFTHTYCPDCAQEVMRD